MEKTSISGFITTRCFQIQKKGTGQGAECGRAGGGVLGQEQATRSRETGSHAGDLPPPLRWTFQQILGGSGDHPGATPNARAGVGVGRRAERLGEAGARPLPHLRQCVEVTGEGLVPGPGPPGQERGWPGQDLPPHCSCSLWGDQSLKSKHPPLHAPRPKSPEMLAALEKGQRAEGRERKGQGLWDLPPEFGAQPVAPDHCLLDSTGVGRGGGDQCILHTQGHLRNPTR